MKNYFFKILFVVLIINSIVIIKGFIGLHNTKANKHIILASNTINNDIYLNSKPFYQYVEPKEEIVYDGLTLKQLGKKIDNVLNSSLDGYGETLASASLDAGVDPIVAASIILVETGCKWSCSTLVTSCNNIGGMKGSGCGSYAKFNTLEEGIMSFINNLANNYYAKGLNTPELMNKKYAANPNWHQKVNNYVNIIKAS